MKSPVAARLPWRTGLAAGLALIVATNAVTLGLVAWNRGGEPEAVLTLSERELDRPWSWRGRHGENSGLVLTLRWRVAPSAAAHPIDDPSLADGAEAWAHGGTAHWLDEAKLTELGIPPQTDSRRHSGRSHGVLLVLEQDGDAYQRSLDRARRHLANETALRESNADKPEFAERVKRASDRLADQQYEASRLFVVDAGRDVASLRARYPDRRRYAIVAGQIRPAWRDPRQPQASLGTIERIDAQTINVPHGLRTAVPPDPGRQRGQPAGTTSDHFAAEIAFGRRLEPWLLRVTAAAGAAPTP